MCADHGCALLRHGEACDVLVRRSCGTGVSHNWASGLILGRVAYHLMPWLAPVTSWLDCDGLVRLISSPRCSAAPQPRLAERHGPRLSRYPASEDRPTPQRERCPS